MNKDKYEDTLTSFMLALLLSTTTTRGRRSESNQSVTHLQFSFATIQPPPSCSVVTVCICVWVKQHHIIVVSQFRVCVLWRTRPLWSVKASPSESLLTSSVVVKCDSRAFGAFPGCVSRCFTLASRFRPPRPANVTIYATQCRHFLSIFLQFLACKESWDMWGHEGS